MAQAPKVDPKVEAAAKQFLASLAKTNAEIDKARAAVVKADVAVATVDQAVK